ncbi:hypothetical protein C4580_05030 [Candidatus Woesearchaeota archaeon]|nr:MAG: hypothetical protein C4580_05030 [Candidatus Woesearchaeota archaeon]
MKKIAMFIVMLALVAVGASALQVGIPNLGSSNQDRNANVTTQFTIVNDGTSPLTGITIQLSGNPAYSLSAPGSIADLAAGQAATVTLSGFIPLTHNAVDPTTLQAQALPVGTVIVSGNNGSLQLTQTVNVTAQARNQLELKKVRIQCDTTSKSLDNGDTIKNLKPGEDCTMEVEVENLFNDNENAAKTSGITFQTIDIRVDSSSSDIDVDDDSDDIEDLDAGDEDSLTFDLNIEDDADARTVTIDVTVKGTDENGAIHGEAQKVRMEIERLTHDIQVQSVDISPSQVESCDAQNVKVTARVLNLGKRNEDDVAVEVSIPDLKFQKKSATIELDQDDESTFTFDVPVPKGQKAGTVRVDVNTFFDTVAPSNSASVDLIVSACEDGSEEAPTQSGQQTTTQPVQTTPVVVTPPTSGGVAAQPRSQTQSSSFTDSNAYVALLVVASVVIVLVLIGMVAMLVRSRQP